ncbi:hypothetical protein J3E68DRAFT_418282 [Trichoderma sp. SZMC 28012]
MEGDENPCKPLAAKETRKMIPQKVARWQFAIRRNARPRLRSGSFPVHERNQLRKEANLVIGKTAFVRLCQSVASEIGYRHLRFEGDAIDTIQEVCEAFLVNHFEALNVIAQRRKSVTVMPTDAVFLKWLLNMMGHTPKENSSNN